MRPDWAPMRERQARLLLEINSLVAEIRDASATTIEDFLALLDVALERELDLAPEIAFYGPAAYPIIARLLRALARTAPGFEFNSLRRCLSCPGEFEQLMGHQRSVNRRRLIPGQSNRSVLMTRRHWPPTAHPSGSRRARELVPRRKAPQEAERVGCRDRVNKPRRGGVMGQSCSTRLPRMATYQS
jgi:hypothetical protein